MFHPHRHSVCLLVCVAALVFSSGSGAPVSTGHEPDLSKVLDFMKEYGYLAKGLPNAEAIYREEAISEAIKTVQKFGAIPQTGKIDNATINLMRSPRCGVPDIIRSDTNNQQRQKRFVIGSPGWKKRTIYYLLANWASRLNQEDVSKTFRLAFDTWARYSRLNFIETTDRNCADIEIAFGVRNHGDYYPFDGPGFVLAHAYFPYQMGRLGGDVHFDDEEIWSLNATDDGVELLAVAVHEIGHSLGLAHSADYGSIMFPYYKSGDESRQLGYDDIIAVYNLYIARRLEEDDENVPERERTDISENENEEEKRNDEERKREEEEKKREEEKQREEEERQRYEDRLREEEEKRRFDAKRREEEEKRRYDEKRRVEEEKRRKDLERRREEEKKEEESRNEEEQRREYERRKHEEEYEYQRREYERRRQYETVANEQTTTTTPYYTFVGDDESVDDHIRHTKNKTSIDKQMETDGCAGNYDTVSLIRGELMIFKGENVWRMADQGQPKPGYPVNFRHLFCCFPDYIKKIDALYERKIDGNVLLFTGNEYWEFDGDRIQSSPRPLTDFGLPSDLDSLDAVFNWPKNEKTFFFRRNKYWRYDENTRRLDKGYPLEIKSRWRGVPNDIDTVFAYSDKMTYFFKNNSYWRFQDDVLRVSENSPLPAAQVWLGCPEPEIFLLNN